MLRLVMQLKIYFFKHKDRREREKKRDAFLATQEHQKSLYLNCPKMKNPIGSNIRKIHHVLDPVEQ